ncbi:cytochrome P450 [Marasmius fiardii PR-910]|nr:cytochrome P450 [Marasmius fiardii PR-910]
MRQPMMTELNGWHWALSHMRYSVSWRLHRRTFHQFFQPRMISDYNDIQRKRTASLVQKLTSSPKDFFKHVRTHSGGIILEIVYGYHIQDNADPYVQLADNAIEAAREADVPGSFLVDYIPLLKYLPAWFPGASFKSKAEVWARAGDQLRNEPWAILKQSMVDGTAVPCFSTRSLEKYEKFPGDDLGMEEVIKNCAAIAFAAGADTAVSAILSFILAMTLNPQIQVLAQKELDERPFDGYPSRRCVVLAHAAVNDDDYEGFLIPGGSTVVANAWAVLHDESLYGPDVMNFNPDRFIKEGKDVPPNPELIAFGFGRRICPGRYLAFNSVWLAITYLLANFSTAKEVDKDGKEIVPAVEYMEGLLSHPLPFNCRFIPNSNDIQLPRLSSPSYRRTTFMTLRS